MKLLIASNNAHKIAEIKHILSSKFEEMFTPSQLNIHCDPEENGNTFLENALIKATEIAKYTDIAVLADDTGLCVDALNGAPGVLSARYAESHNDAANRKKLLNALSTITNRAAHFETVVVLRYPNGDTLIGNGRVDGKILNEERGNNGFGYDSLFYCDELEKTFAEASEDDKNSVSHRGRALQNLLEQL